MSYEENTNDEFAQAADNSSWLGGWFQAAKEKSMSAVNMVKKDLAEFTSTMQQDTTRIAGEVKTRVMQESASSATQKVKDGMNNLFGGLSKALSTENGPESGVPIARKSVPKDAVFNRSKARLRAIQVDPDTYTGEPSGDREAFAAWAGEFDVEKRKEEIAELLVSNVEVRSLYTQLVPMQVKHVDFWTRYFYKVHQLQQDEARRAQLLMRVDVVAQQQHKDGDWEPDSDWGDIEGPNSPTGTEAPEVLSMPVDGNTVDKTGVSGVATSTTPPVKVVDRLTLSGLQCPSDVPSDSETSQAASSSDKAASSSFATVTSASSPSTQSAGLEDMECSSSASDSDEPLTLKVKVPAQPAPPSPTPATAVAAATVAMATVDLGDHSASHATSTAATVTTIDASPSPHAKDSNGEDDWEKEFDVDAGEDNHVHTTTAQSALSTGTTNAEAEDWESWE